MVYGTPKSVPVYNGLSCGDLLNLKPGTTFFYCSTSHGRPTPSYSTYIFTETCTAEDIYPQLGDQVSRTSIKLR